MPQQQRDYLWDMELDKIKNSDLQGIISYYEGDLSKYPTVIYEPPIESKMGNEQSKDYLGAFHSEIKKIAKGPPKPELFYTEPEKYKQLHAEFIFAVKRIESRRLGNLYYGNLNAGTMSVDDKEILGDETIDNDGKEPVEQKMKKPDVSVEKNGWMTKDILLNPGLEQLSPKMSSMIKNIIKPENIRQKHVIFSSIKTNQGLYFIKTLFNWCGVPVELFTGDLSDQKRQKLINDFNSKENSYGDLIKILLVSEAGVEGITLKDVGHFHFLESNPIGGKMDQAIGRVARFGSHEQLPKEDQVVRIWRYFAIPENDSKDELKLEQSIDKYLYSNSKTTKDYLDEFLQRLIDNSIEKIDSIFGFTNCI